MSDIEFVDGLIVKAPHENAPDFIKCKISIKRKDLGNWLRKKEGDWINLDIKVSKDGKWYAAVDTWVPKSKGEQTQSGADKTQTVDEFDDDIPF